MITITISEIVKSKGIISFKRYLKLYKSSDKARKELAPIVQEMKLAKKQKRDPAKNIVAVSYDLKSEKTLLLELGAITTTENESNDE